MPNRSTDALFQLVKSLQKAEKRNFKLYVKRNTAQGDLKVVQLFDLLDKMSTYDETALLKRNSAIKKQQLPNIKAHLYRQILSSLRVLESNSNLNLQLHEQLDYAKILYGKGLYHQSLRLIERIKEGARANSWYHFLSEVLVLEKKIETLHITRSMEDKAENLTAEVLEANAHVQKQSRLSNLALKLYSWYIKNGFARDAEDERQITAYMEENFTADMHDPDGFYECLFYNQIFCWYAFILQDYLLYYRYTQKWVNLFDKYPQMLSLETGHYIKGVHNLLNAHFSLRNHTAFKISLDQFDRFAGSEVISLNDNNRIQVFVYLNIAKINYHFLTGRFEEGISLVPAIVETLAEYELYLDQHRTLVFYYKIASLYFGAGDYGKAIDFLNLIINKKTNLRNDLQCYARLLHLIAHYEIGNYQLIEYLIKSVYRFMANMKNLSRVEEEIFKFIRKTFYMSPAEVKPAFRQLLETIEQFEGSKFETRAFAYLDILSWLESKVYDKKVYEVIREKFELREKKKALKRARLKVGKTHASIPGSGDS